MIAKKPTWRSAYADFTAEERRKLKKTNLLRPKDPPNYDGTSKYSAVHKYFPFQRRQLDHVTERVLRRLFKGKFSEGPIFSHI